MLIIDTWDHKSPTHSDQLQLEMIFAGLVQQYRYCLLGIDEDSSDITPFWEERAHECRTIALQVSVALKMDIREAQEYLSPNGEYYVG